jgi:hypothetical protein
LVEIVNTAPRFSAVLSAEARVESQSVALSFGTREKTKYGIEFGIEIVPSMITALTSLLGEVYSKVPESSRLAPAVLSTASVALAMNEFSEVALVFGLEGGGEITLPLPAESLPGLRDQISEAILASGRPSRN